MKNNIRRNYQRSLTKMIKGYNKAVNDDPMFLGRFVMRQVGYRWSKFEDNSGGILVAFIRCFDKKTGNYKDYSLRYAPYFKTNHWHIGMDIFSNFIVEVSGFWDETPRHTVKNAEDFRNVSVPYEAFQIHNNNYSFYEMSNINDLLEKSS